MLLYVILNAVKSSSRCNVIAIHNHSLSIWAFQTGVFANQILCKKAQHAMMTVHIFIISLITFALILHFCRYVIKPPSSKAFDFNNFETITHHCLTIQYFLITNDFTFGQSAGRCNAFRTLMELARESAYMLRITASAQSVTVCCIWNLRRYFFLLFTFSTKTQCSYYNSGFQPGGCDLIYIFIQNCSKCDQWDWITGSQTLTSDVVETVTFDRPRERGVQPGRRPGTHKCLWGPWTSTFKNETGNYAQSFYCYSFIYTVLCILIDWSCFFSRYAMYRHFFWCPFGKISIAAVALLVQCTKHSVMWRNSRKYALWRHMRFHSAQYCYRMNPVLSVCVVEIYTCENFCDF